MLVTLLESQLMDIWEGFYIEFLNLASNTLYGLSLPQL